MSHLLLQDQLWHELLPRFKMKFSEGDYVEFWVGENELYWQNTSSDKYCTKKNKICSPQKDDYLAMGNAFIGILKMYALYKIPGRKDVASLKEKALNLYIEFEAWGGTKYLK